MQPLERVETLSAAEAASLAAEREARRAAGLVATFVGVPAAVAAGAALLVSALAVGVLLAPIAAAVLTWVAWRYGKADPGAPAS